MLSWQHLYTVLTAKAIEIFLCLILIEKIGALNQLCEVQA